MDLLPSTFFCTVSLLTLNMCYTQKLSSRGRGLYCTGYSKSYYGLHVTTQIFLFGFSRVRMFPRCRTARLIAAGCIYCAHDCHAYCTFGPCVSLAKAQRICRGSWASSIVKTWIVSRTYLRHMKKWGIARTNLVKYTSERVSVLLTFVSEIEELKRTLSQWTDSNSTGKLRADPEGEGFTIK